LASDNQISASRANAQNSHTSIPGCVLLKDSMAAPRCAPTVQPANAQKRVNTIGGGQGIWFQTINLGQPSQCPEQPHLNSRKRVAQGLDGRAEVCADGPACERAKTSQYHRGRSRNLVSDNQISAN
jgi:hypothetical protein